MVFVLFWVWCLAVDCIRWLYIFMLFVVSAAVVACTLLVLCAAASELRHLLLFSYCCLCACLRACLFCYVDVCLLCLYIALRFVYLIV